MPRQSRIDLPESKINSAGKDGGRVGAKSLVAFRAVGSLGMSGTEVGGHLCLSQSAVSRAVLRGEEIAGALGVELVEETNA